MTVEKGSKLKVYTAQYRYNGKDRLDITVKTGSKVFAPTWDMVMGSKSGRISEAEYERRYRELMKKSQEIYWDVWDELLSMDEVTLVCFCRKGKFCHRILLAKILEELGAEYMGER